MFIYLPFVVDGYRLALNKDPAFQVEETFLVPPGAMKLLPIFGKEPCSLSVGERYISFANDTICILSRIPANDGFNVDGAIPQSSLEEIDVNVDDFIGELKYLNEFLPGTCREAVRFDRGTLSLKTPAAECQSTLELSQIPQTVCGFSAKYMLDGLEQFHAKKVKTVLMGLTSPVSPILLTDDDSSDLAMVLPCRLKAA